MAMRNRGSIVKRGPDKHLVRVYVGLSPKGRRKYVSKTVYGDRREAQQRLTEMLGQHDGEGLVASKNTTVVQFIHLWLDNKAKEITPRTYQSYETVLRLYVIPHLGGMRLQKLGKGHIQALWTNLRENHGLSPKSIQLTHTVFGQVLRAAVEDRILSRDPSKGVKTYKVEQTTKKTLTPKQVALFLETARGVTKTCSWSRPQQWYTVFHLLLTTGMRPSEALALSWEDLDLDEGTAVVHKALHQHEPGKWEVRSGTKTQAGRRKVNLPASTVQVLRDHRQSQARIILEAGSGYLRSGRVFAGKQGQVLNPVVVSRKWRQYIKLAGLPEGIRLYDARHTHATILMASGANPKVVADRLGHADIQTTLQTYSHVSPELAKETADTVERVLFSGGQARSG